MKTKGVKKHKKVSKNDKTAPLPPLNIAEPRTTIISNTQDTLTVKLYIIHAAHLSAQRKDNFVQLTKSLAENPRITLHTNLVATHDPTSITQDEISKFVSLSRTEDSSPWNAHVQNMHVNQVSNALKHYRALSVIAQSDVTDGTIHLVVEDDVLYAANIGSRLLDLAAIIPRDHEIVFLGLPSKPKDASAGFSLESTKTLLPVLPGCDSYIVSPTAAKKLAAKYLPVRFMSNKQLTYAAEMAGIDTQQSSPNVFSDGSKVGKFCSTLTPNSALIYNNEWVAAWHVLQPGNSNVSQEEVAQVGQQLSTCDARDHPDILHMRARLLQKTGDYAAAQKLFTDAYTKYESNGAILNAESEFMNCFVDNFKYLQTIPIGCKLATV